MKSNWTFWKPPSISPSLRIPAVSAAARARRGTRPAMRGAAVVGAYEDLRCVCRNSPSKFTYRALRWVRQLGLRANTDAFSLSSRQFHSPALIRLRLGNAGSEVDLFRRGTRSNVVRWQEGIPCRTRYPSRSAWLPPLSHGAKATAGDLGIFGGTVQRILKGAQEPLADFCPSKAISQAQPTLEVWRQNHLILGPRKATSLVALFLVKLLTLCR